jgi:23S rRNA pseudouridine2605 synthase
MRINKFLASCGVGSRRKVEEFILNGDVSVNGKVVTDLSTDINENTDIVKYNGRIVKLESDKVYIMLNKPKGYLCTVSDDRDRPTVMKLIKEEHRVYPIGRLDFNTEGLLLLTNDGELANKIMHPSGKISKTYLVTLKSKPKSDELDKLRKGVILEDGMTQPAILERPKLNNGLYEVVITIFEGRNRQVRRMFEAIGYKVFALKRFKIGQLELGDLELKKYKYLNEKELEKIFK